jgi:alkaline phosphatase
MVEGGQIDWLMHSMVDDATLVDEIVDFDQAVEHVVRWAEARGDTLVIVTADHDHTLSVLDNHYAFKEEQNCRAARACGGNHDYPSIDISVDGVQNGEGLSDATLQGEFKPVMHLQYGWIVQEANKRKGIAGPHSANFVPLFAWGPGASKFGGYLDQPVVGARLIEVGNYATAE